jgi:hypothetical protein
LYPQTGQGPLYSCKNALSRLFLRFTIDHSMIPFYERFSP